MSRLPMSAGSWRRQAIVLLLLVTLGPALLISAAQIIEVALSPLIPWIITAIILFGLYRLVIGRYRR